MRQSDEEVEAMTVEPIELVEPEIITLTKRQLEVLMLIVEGKSDKDVADTLYISGATVRSHLANIYDKLQVSNRVQAFRRATRLGLLPLD